jgi:hypothetical protein
MQWTAYKAKESRKKNKKKKTLHPSPPQAVQQEGQHSSP